MPRSTEEPRLGFSRSDPAAGAAAEVTPKSEEPVEATPGTVVHVVQMERVIHGTLSDDSLGGWRRVLSDILAFLLHVAILAFLIFGPMLEEPPVEPPTIPVEIVTLPPKPKLAQRPKPQPKLAPKPHRAPEPTPPLEHLESGGNPDLEPGKPSETKAPEAVKQAAETPQPPQPQPPPPQALSNPQPQPPAPAKPQPTPAPRQATKPQPPALALKLPPTLDQTAPQVASLPPASRAKPREAPSSPPPGSTPHVKPSAPAQIDSDLRGQGGGDRYLNAMRDEIVSNLIYPSAGRGNRGVAKYDMVLGRNGYVLQLRLAQSSGSTALDRAGMDAIQNSAPFQPLPPNVPGQAVGIRVTLFIAP